MAAPSLAAALSGFDLFWHRYPNKFGHEQARAVWDELEPSAREQEAILGALAIQAGDDFRTLMAGGSAITPTAAVWLYTRHLRENAPGRACADWRIALETHRSSSPRAALVLDAGLRVVRQLFRRRCSGFLHHAAQRAAGAGEVEAARGPCVDSANGGELRVLVCTRRREDCEACARFQAFRQLVATNAGIWEWRTAFPGETEAHISDGDGERAQVDHGNDQAWVSAVGKKGPRGCNAHLHSVVAPRAPEVHHAERCAQQRNSQGHGFEDRFVHAAEVKARRSLLIWACVILLSLLLAATPFVLDGPDEFEAARDTAATVADAIADAQRVARSERVSQ